MRALEVITDHVIVKLRYSQIYQMKTTHGLSSELNYLCHLVHGFSQDVKKPQILCKIKSHKSRKSCQIK